LYISDNKVEHSIGNFISWLLGANEDMRELHSKINHPSETALDNANFDYVINNNGTIEELVEKVRDILVKEKIIC
jgi:DNA-directed RNA polymerase subunit L